MQTGVVNVECFWLKIKFFYKKREKKTNKMKQEEVNWMLKILNVTNNKSGVKVRKRFSVTLTSDGHLGTR
jgi:hypothetical protein